MAEVAKEEKGKNVEAKEQNPEIKKEEKVEVDGLGMQDKNEQEPGVVPKKTFFTKEILVGIILIVGCCLIFGIRTLIKRT